MLNQVICVGRVSDIFDNYIAITVPRSYKNSKGVYENDIIPVKLSESIFNNVKQYCNTNDIVGIKGKLESEGTLLTVIGEKVTFLSSTATTLKGGEEDVEGRARESFHVDGERRSGVSPLVGKALRGQNSRTLGEADGRFCYKRRGRRFSFVCCKAC